MLVISTARYSFTDLVWSTGGTSQSVFRYSSSARLLSAGRSVP
jgi:hypothetical protein